MTSHRWIEPPDIELPDALREAVGGHPLVALTLARRGIVNVEAALAFLNPNYYWPASPFDLPDMARAVARIGAAITADEPVIVWGDFDVDGQTSTAVLVETLRRHGAQVGYHIPIRQDGHGVNQTDLVRLIDDGARLIVTCDCGVSALDEIAYARTRGVDVIITDHHQMPPDVPAAYAILNPQLLPADHLLRGLPGVGCAYLLASALDQTAGHPDDTARSLDLLALGIVADVAPQTGDTRYLLQRGLAALRTTDRVGLRALFGLLNIDSKTITEEQIAFMIAPRLNALGRLDNANRAVDFLTTLDGDHARTLASVIEGLNAERRLLSSQVFTAARAQVESDESLRAAPVLVLGDPEWHPGVLGLVANRLVERYLRPAIVLALPPGQMAHGSARSVPGFDITAALAAQSDLLATYGGHAGAAGLSLSPERVGELRRRMAVPIAPVAGAVEAGALAIDGYVTLADLTLDLIADLDRLAPFGVGNPAPILAARGLHARAFGAAGRGDEHTQVVVEDDTGSIQRVIWWHGGGKPPPSGHFDLAFAIRANDYRGERTVQVEWLDARATDDEEDDAQIDGALALVDCRNEADPVARLSALLAADPTAQVWGEGELPPDVTARGRGALVPAATLAIWTPPPGPNELKAVLARVAPATVYLFSADPATDTVDPFLRRLIALTKSALAETDAGVGLAALAEATAQRETTVRAGLAWLVARGHITFSEEGDLVRLAQGDGESRPDMSAHETRLASLLRETAAYRTYFRRAATLALGIG